MVETKFLVSCIIMAFLAGIAITLWVIPWIETYGRKEKK